MIEKTINFKFGSIFNFNMLSWVAVITRNHTMIVLTLPVKNQKNLPAPAPPSPDLPTGMPTQFRTPVSAVYQLSKQVGLNIILHRLFKSYLALDLRGNTYYKFQWSNTNRFFFSINEQQYINEFMSLAFCDAQARGFHLADARVS